MEVGLFGKLPSHGDFLRRRVTDSFVDAWDAWLRESLSTSRLALGDAWLDLYLTSPAWRFICASGACGPRPAIGLMVPSVDRVGRYFPLTLVAHPATDVNLVAATEQSTAFFDRAERLIIDTLATDDIDFDRFDAEVAAMGEALDSILPPRIVLDASVAGVLEDGSRSWQFPTGSARELPAVLLQMLSQRLSSAYAPLTFWWTEGSSVVEPSCLVTKGLPQPEAFAGFLDGGWARSRWQPVAARIDTGATIEMGTQHVPPVGFRSAAASDVGLVRKINEDAFLERSEVGIWAVADGLGGHRDGEVASHMVCDALADLVPDRTFDRTIEAARERLQAVNDYLLGSGPHATLTDHSASTVVMLLARGASCAVLWAGDSRLYRWRAGELALLTRDHSLGESDRAAGQETSNVITRAVGVQPFLTLDLLRERALVGDRFLLCSDGLTRTIPEVRIKEVVGSPDIRQAVRELIEASRAAGAPDNVTVVIAEAFSDDD